MSPEQVELSYRNGLKKLEDLLERAPGWAVILATIFLGAAMLVIAPYFHFNLSNGPTGGFRVMFLIRYAAPLAVVLSAIALVVRDDFRAPYHWFCLAVLWYAYDDRAYSRVEQVQHDSSLLHLALVPALCLLGYLYLRYPTRHRVREAIIFSVLFWSLVIFDILSLRVATDPIFHYGFFKVQFVWYAFLMFAIHRNDSARTAMAFCPVNALHGTIWPHDMRLQLDDKRRLWWAGFIRVVIGYILGLLVNYLRVDVETKLELFSLPRHLVRSEIHLIGDVAEFNAIVGFARMFGYRVRDATNFAMLSRTPAEFWQRISVYNYLFVLQSVKLPLFRLTRSHFFSTFCALLVFFFNRMGTWAITDWIDKRYWPGGGVSLEALFFLNWLLLIFITRKWWFVSAKKRTDARYAWLSIFLTHLAYGGSLYCFLKIWQVLV
jgi:hypothetical protein